jgi:flagellar hook-associated protein 2
MPGANSIQGLASNLDTASIVDSMIEYERVPVTYMEDDVKFKTQQVAAYQAVLAKFMALQSQVSLMKRESSFNKASINVSDESVLSASAGASITSGSYNVRVLSLARNHQLASQGFNDATTTSFGTGYIKLSVGDTSMTTINIESGNNSLMGIKEAINNANTGITASIINDGTSSNPYRLLLTSNKTGAANDINFEVSLNGGGTLDFVNSSFDAPEEVSFSSGSTSNVSLGSTASYTGSTNKVYSFTVGGTGTQTIGSDNITLNWTVDGVNYHSILITQADNEYELVGDGAEGLKLSFSAGDLVAGDTFQVTAFSPLVQAAADAQISVGSDGSGGGSPIIVNSDSNEFDDVLPGLTLNVKKISDPGESVTISSAIDSSAVKTMINDMIDDYNGVMDFINSQFTYDQDTTESGVLFADYSLQVMQASVRRVATQNISGLNSIANSLSAIGIRSDANGKLAIANSSRLTDAIENNTDDLVKLFIDSGTSSSPYIEFISATSDTKSGEDYDVQITQAATKGYFQGAGITDPATNPITLDATNNVLKIKVDGTVSNDLVLTERTYNSGAELANEIQTRIDADTKLAGKGVTVEWVDIGEQGYLKITGGTYGSNSKVEMVTSIANSGFSVLGLGAGVRHTGNDVAGTINGEKATGNGRILTGDEDNANTAGLKIKVTLSSNQLVTGVEGTVSIVKGLASRMNEALEGITKSIDGSIARRTSSLNKQIEAINKQIEDYDARLEKRREDLYEEFNNMESVLAELQSENTYLTSQLSSLQNNWNQILGSSKS